MEKPVSESVMTKMPIHVKGFEDWMITASNPGGLSCRDVFEAIYRGFQIPLTEEEHAKLIPPKSERLREAQKHYRRRCKTSAGGISGRLEKAGIMRIDVLGDQTVFMGLRQDPEDRFWVLELGLPKSGP
ncbi:hypothetical protein BXZ70DRAFT_489241 [Cristinia sonorae]|uniref:DUF6699 domain-containing protein n=1 Tax=Cristinia sonorae TaxID=1940300 RepID=A0A8K0UHL8_9AGAR|nr:hypothetical protein BXZ70DRAFT_489241 [Cristinia sonorae]